MINEQLLFLLIGLGMVVYLLPRIVRNFKMKALSKKLNFYYEPYLNSGGLFSKLAYVVKLLAEGGYVLNFIEGRYADKDYIVFDFYHFNFSLFDDYFIRRITFINGKYYKCNQVGLEKVIVVGDFSGCTEVLKKSEYLRHREVAMVNTYANLKLGGVEIKIDAVRRIINAFRSVNYKNASGRLDDLLSRNKLNIPADELCVRVGKTLDSWKARISQKEIEIVIDTYLKMVGF
jgi:hypothetical protein